jgi:hypothetical protein
MTHNVCPRRFFCAGLFLLAAACLFAQETPVIKIGGSLTGELTSFVHDFKDSSEARSALPGDFISGSLNFSAAGEQVEGFIGMKLSASAFTDLAERWPHFDDALNAPLLFDEAYLRAFLGPVSVEAGFRKLKWGKADSLGPLDVINPLDYSSLTNITDILAMKIARPMIHVTWNAGDFSKLEAVFIPNFAGHRFDYRGRWQPQVFSALSENMIDSARQQFGAGLQLAPNNFLPAVQERALAYFSSNDIFPDTSGADFFQTGLRFTTTAGEIDLGVQYFYGNLFRPGITLPGFASYINDLYTQNLPPTPFQYYGDPSKLAGVIEYSRYHQIGADYAQALAGFTIRAELAGHITEDLAGDDGAVRNPFIGWSLGFDRDLFWDLNLNVQCNETIRLLDDKAGANPLFDSEAGTDITATRLTLRLSRKFLYDELECAATAIWDIEDSGCYCVPQVIWKAGGLRAELSAGIFADNESGELGWYWKNSFVKAGISYSF